MQIVLNNIGKRYNREWIFKGVNHLFTPGTATAITGPNGSGKSTLLQVIAGAIQYTEGTLTYTNGEAALAPENVYQHLSIATPYLELIEEMTAAEFLQFHTTFKPLDLPITDVLKEVGLEAAANKQIRYYSSGMKQRLKLAQAVFSKTSLLLLDEPCTNLDAAGIAVYQQLIANHCAGKVIIVSSNDPQEYAFCKQVLAVEQYK